MSISRLPEPAEDSLRVVVSDSERGATHEYHVSGEHAATVVAQDALSGHDTATDDPAGVTVTVYSAAGDVLAQHETNTPQE